MAIKRSENWLNQQRVDVPHIRSIESAVRNDFDDLSKSLLIGENSSYIIRGFKINMTGAINSSANSLQMIVANSAILHGTSNESGTFFEIPSSEPNQTLNSNVNTNVSGSFTPSAINYVGFEFQRSIDNSTASQVFFWNPASKIEFSKNIPLSETLNYQLVITSSVWSSNVVPIAIIETDASNNVISVEDRRSMLFRLGTAGSATPNPFYVYPWNHDAEGRVENFWKSTSSSSSPFNGGDKQLLQFKEWADAMMSRFVEIIGGPYWYSLNSAGSLLKIKGDLDRLQMTGNGEFIHSSVTPGLINWTSDVYLNFIGSRLSYRIDSNDVPGTDLTLVDNEVAYINIVRGVDITPNLIFTNGSTGVTSVGSVPWTTDLIAGDFIKVASENDTKYYQIDTVEPTMHYSVTLTEVYADTSTGSGGVQAKYAYGSYQVVASPSTDRHVHIADRKDVPFTEDIYWLLLRADNGGATPRIYIRGSSGGELEQGEKREVSDNTSLGLLNYAGSTGETDSQPNYLATDVDSQPNIAVTDSTDNLTKAIKELDKTVQSHNAKLIGGGTWSWDLGNNSLSFSADAYISVPGLTNSRNTIPFSIESPIVLSADGQIAYVDINRTSGAAANLVVSTGDIAAVSLTKNRTVIARRVGNDVLVGNGTFLLKGNSQYIERLELEGALAEINRYFGQFRLTQHESNANQVRSTGSDVSLLDGRILSQQLNSLVVDFSGAVIDFTTGTITKEDGSTALGINFTPFSVPSNEYFWYGVALIPSTVGVDNKISAQLLISSASSSSAVKANAILPALAGNRKLGAVQVFNNGGTIEVSDIRVFGQGGGGSATSGLDENYIDLRDSFDNSSYNYLTSDIFSIDSEDFTDSGNTTATFKLVDGVYGFTVGQTFQSIDLIDSSFLDLEKDPKSVQLTVFSDSQATNGDATFEVSRDSATTWQAINLTRNDSTTEFSGVLEFAEETPSDTSTIPSNNSSLELNTTIQKSLAQPFTLSNPTVLTKLQFDLVKTGSPTGFLTVKVAADNAGDPGSTLFETQLNIQDLSAGTIAVDLYKKVLKSGSYWFVFETDSDYKSVFAASTTSISIESDSGAASNFAEAFDSGWTPTTHSIGYQISYKELSLLVRITATNTFNLNGLGLMYDEDLSFTDFKVLSSIIVGNTSDVAMGIATHTSIQDALNSTGNVKEVRLLSRTFAENIIISSGIKLIGEGSGSQVSGTVTVNGDENYLKDLKVLGDLTINGNYSKFDMWIDDSNILDSGESNSVNIIWGV